MKKQLSLKKTVLYILFVAAFFAVFSVFTLAAKTSAPEVTGIKITGKTSTAVSLEWTVKGKASGYRI